jgi:integrase/recombinase XerD
MRVTELVSLPLSAVFKAGKINDIIMVMGKGSKERIIPINGQAKSAIAKYLEIREEYIKSGFSKKYLFPANSESGYLSRSVFFNDLKHLSRLADINPLKVSPHVLRHSFATHILSNGANLRTVQTLLGHEDIATTEIYTHIMKDKLKISVSKFHPLSKKNK